MIIGKSGTGKSSLLLQYKDQLFSESCISKGGIAHITNILEIDGKTVHLNIWDAPGHERLRTVVRCYYEGCDGYIIVFDKNNRQSFLDIGKFLSDIKIYSSKHRDILLVGNKTDLESDVSYDEAHEFARGNNIVYFEACSKNYESVFFYLIT